MRRSVDVMIYDTVSDFFSVNQALALKAQCSKLHCQCGYSHVSRSPDRLWRKL
jgi:hypothetical protein